MKKYDHQRIEKKWQKIWEQNGLYVTNETSGRPKSYVLDMFPYPSGEGLHVGHPKGYIATDVYSRYKRMNGHEILHPMGWDAFGLPAENFAIKNKVHPRIATAKNIAHFKEQLGKIGFNYDWSREINTTDPKYYKWTQWIFLQLFKRGLAYESDEPINWCPSCKTGLANEDLEDGACERCGSVVEKRPIRQWVLKITDYADRLLNDLEKLPHWPLHIKEMQRQWIGRSEGTLIKFKTKNEKRKTTTKNEKPDIIEVFTTRPDTLFGATYLVLAPEHSFVGESSDLALNRKEIEAYVASTRKKDVAERTGDEREKTGVELKGIRAINPAINRAIPIWIADYVLADVGTGAIMAVPAHDERDWDFAQKYNLDIKNVIQPDFGGVGVQKTQKITGHYQDALSESEEKYKKILNGEAVFTQPGILTNSGQFDALDSEEAKSKIAAFVGGIPKVTYRLRDWVFSRQRYWGEPIPLIHCETCGVVPVPESDLPVLLPEVERYEPTGTGESPLAAINEWVNTTCPKCGGAGKRETNTMPQWAGSSWYYLRFMDPNNDENPVDGTKEKYWAPVDLYVGGAEHATRHLIYARFWHKFLFDINVVSTEEPFDRLQSVGLILAEDGRKMSKRYGNVINPDDIVDRVGADTLRVYEMFMGPFGEPIAWSTDNMVGSRRFLEKLWRLGERPMREDMPANLESLLHATIKKVGDDIEALKFNTAISALMIFTNALDSMSKNVEDGTHTVSRKAYETLLLLMAPFAPHIAEELWSALGKTTSVHEEPWPAYNPKKIHTATVRIAVQINGKVRDAFEVPVDTDEETIKRQVCDLPKVQKWLEGKEIQRIIVVRNRLVNIVV